MQAHVHCPKCGCSVVHTLSKDRLECENCHHIWQGISEKQKAELKAFAEKVLGIKLK